MNFTKILDKNSCDCLKDASENITDIFVRKVRRSGNLSNSDFRNHIERNKTPENENDCEEICGLYGVSIEIWNDASRKPLMEKYLTTAAISPQNKKNLCVIKLKNGSGLIKHTPDQLEYNEFHYDFYKEDSFTVDNLDLIEMIPLNVA